MPCCSLGGGHFQNSICLHPQEDCWHPRMDSQEIRRHPEIRSQDDCRHPFPDTGFISRTRPGSISPDSTSEHSEWQESNARAYRNNTTLQSSHCSVLHLHGTHVHRHRNNVVLHQHQPPRVDELCCSPPGDEGATRWRGAGESRATRSQGVDSSSMRRVPQGPPTSGPSGDWGHLSLEKKLALLEAQRMLSATKCRQYIEDLERDMRRIKPQKPRLSRRSSSCETKPGSASKQVEAAKLRELACKRSMSLQLVQSWLDQDVDLHIPLYQT